MEVLGSPQQLNQSNVGLVRITSIHLFMSSSIKRYIDAYIHAYIQTYILLLLCTYSYYFALPIVFEYSISKKNVKRKFEIVSVVIGQRDAGRVRDRDESEKQSERYVREI